MVHPPLCLEEIQENLFASLRSCTVVLFKPISSLTPRDQQYGAVVLVVHRLKYGVWPQSLIKNKR